MGGKGCRCPEERHTRGGITQGRRAAQGNRESDGMKGQIIKGHELSGDTLNLKTKSRIQNLKGWNYEQVDSCA
ncbi:hypothetical protein JCM16138_05260 [Thermococcus atlanticus]